MTVMIFSGMVHIKWMLGQIEHREVITLGRVYNFSAGPSMLPEAVLKRAAAEMLDYQGTGESVMEMSHRSGSTRRSLTIARRCCAKS